MRQLTLTALGLAVLLLAGGCTMAPKYQRPDAPIPAMWPGTADSANLEAAAPPAWDAFYQDPTLQDLIRQALLNNRDLRVAMLNIERARAAYQIQRADILPTVNAGGDISTQHLPGEFTGTGVQGINRTYTATVGFTSWEVDIFGRIRSLKDSALEQYFATEEAARAAQVSLISELAAVYMQLAADKEQLTLARSTHENFAKVLELIQALADQGLTSDLELNQARTSVEQARVAIAQWETNVAQDANALALLVGGPVPGDIDMPATLADVPKMPDVPEGLPSELLVNRPDIRQAEYSLRSANANIGAARANFFPRIGLTTSIGTMSAEFNDLFGPGGHTWSFMPGVTLPIFDTGRNLANLWVSEADRDIAVARYEGAIQSAFREVADALAQRATIGEQLAAQAALVDATQKTYDLSLLRYQAGIDDFMSVLDSQRSLFTAQQGMINTRLLRETNAIAVYKSLGGGWSPDLVTTDNDPWW